MHPRFICDLDSVEFAVRSFEMNTWRPLPLFVVFAALISVESTQVLQYSPTSVVCSGPCCPECLVLDGVSDLQKPNSCGERECFPEYISYGAEYAIDNSLQTLWNTSAIYSNIKPVSVGLTLDLGQVSLVQRACFYFMIFQLHRRDMGFRELKCMVKHLCQS